VSERARYQLDDGTKLQPSCTCGGKVCRERIVHPTDGEPLPAGLVYFCGQCFRLMEVLAEPEPEEGGKG
jgi:hypothetical protein